MPDEFLKNESSEEEPSVAPKSETAKQRKARKEREEQELLSQFYDDERELVDDFITVADEKLKTGTTVGGRVSRLKALLSVANKLKDREAFRYGLQQANTRCIPVANYVLSCGLTWKERHET